MIDPLLTDVILIIVIGSIFFFTIKFSIDRRRKKHKMLSKKQTRELEKKHENL